MIDDELTEFERGLLESIAQAKRGEFAAVHTPARVGEDAHCGLIDSHGQSG